MVMEERAVSSGRACGKTGTAARTTHKYEVRRTRDEMFILSLRQSYFVNLHDFSTTKRFIMAFPERRPRAAGSAEIPKEFSCHALPRRPFPMWPPSNRAARRARKQKRSAQAHRRAPQRWKKESERAPTSFIRSAASRMDPLTRIGSALKKS